MSCICIDDLRPASFRGAPFFVASDESNYGRRNAVHEYPAGEDADIEDMGQRAPRFTVQGYLVGDDWMAQRDALVAACTAKGPGYLQLPTDSPGMVNVQTLNVSRTKDACGFYSVKIDFVRGRGAGGLPSIVGVIESQIGMLFNSAIAPFTAAFDLAYDVSGAMNFVIENQVSRVVTFASDVISAAETYPSVAEDLASDTVQAAISIYQSAEEYVQPSSGSDLYLAQQPIVAQTIGAIATDTGVSAVGPASGITVTSGSAAIVPMIAYTINTLGNSMSPDDAVNALTDLASWTVLETELPVTETQTVASASDQADVNTGKVFCGAVRSFALMKLAQALAAKTFLTRSDAIQARASVVELFNSQIAMFEEDEVVNILLTARDLCVRSITQKMATIVPVITIEAQATKPSLYWAARLYEDVSRAEELSDRNGVINPAYMPPTFEALAR